MVFLAVQFLLPAFPPFSVLWILGDSFRGSFAGIDQYKEAKKGASRFFIAFAAVVGIVFRFGGV